MPMHGLRPTHDALRVVLAAAFCGGFVVAQCEPAWAAGDGIPGVDDDVLATTSWDPDGAGPLGARIALGGNFTFAGSVPANRLATYDPATRVFESLGGGVNGSVQALCTLANGDLVVGGAFTSAGGVASNYLARWNGTGWSTFGAGLAGALPGSTSGAVEALLVLPNGDLIVGGQFTLAGGATAGGLARWDGSNWSTFGNTDGVVSSLGRLPNGDIVIGGAFASVGGVLANNIARWNGTTWSALGSGTLPWVTSLLVQANGDLIAGGTFDSAGSTSANGIARWDGSAWSQIGGAFEGSVHALELAANGDLLAGGAIWLPGISSTGVARWDGSAWSAVTGSQATIYTLTALPGGGFVAGGTFAGAGIPHFAVHDVVWQAPSPGFDGPVLGMTLLPGGDLLAVGGFRHAGEVPADRVARWDGSGWAPLGIGCNNPVYCATALPNDDIVVGGVFQSAGGVAANGIARWDGTQWSAMTSSLAGPVYAVHVRANGDLIAGGGGSFAVGANRLGRWNGSVWSSIGTVVGTSVNAFAEAQNGDLLVGGVFTSIDGVACNGIARWDGSAWHALGSGLSGGLFSLNGAFAVTTLPNGDVVVGGGFAAAGGVPAANIARWDGSDWHALGGGLGNYPTSLAILPDGDLAVGGNFSTAGGQALGRLVRWDGSAWTSLANGIAGTAAPSVSCLRFREAELLVGGSFYTAGGTTSAWLARLGAPCAASAMPLGASCTGSGGINLLTARTRPWTGSLMRAVATGMPSFCLSLTETGFGTVSLPLSAILPEGAPGCFWNTTPDYLVLGIPSGGMVDVELWIPDELSLIGLQVYQQVMAVEIDPQLTVLDMTSTNQLLLTIGSY